MSTYICQPVTCAQAKILFRSDTSVNDKGFRAEWKAVAPVAPVAGGWGDWGSWSSCSNNKYHYLHTIYTLSTHYLHTIYTLSTVFPLCLGAVCCWWGGWMMAGY